MGERALNVATKKRLINNQPFAYAHLIKFERPRKIPSVSTIVNTDAARYGYLTDAAFNISFDDGTTDINGNSNGAQIYYANSMSGAGGFSESTDPKATSLTLTVTAETLFNSITRSDITMANSGSTITVPNVVNLIEEGFREGDKVLITGGTNSGKTCVITGIKTNGTVMTVNKVLKPTTADTNIMENSTITDQSSGTSITLKLDTDEMKGPLVEMDNQDNLKSYHNREVSVYKVFLDPTNNSIIGAPYIIFRGLISKTDIVDDPTRNLKVKWYLTSHWGDFVQVNGRLSNDAVHRALNNNGFPQPDVAKREVYATDMGFAHAEDTINILATYKHSEQVEKLKVKKKFFGLSTKVKTYTETEITDRDVDLNFSLSSKYIPVVYGIDKVKGRPVFVDTKSNDSNNVFVMDMLCEGEIGGIYDVYIDGVPSICFNKEDSDDRDVTSGTLKDEASVVCRGRADLGQTLGGAQMSGVGVTGSTTQDWTDHGDSIEQLGISYGTDGQYGQGFQKVTVRGINHYNTTNTSLVGATTVSDAQGLIDRETAKFTTPNNLLMTVHSGKSDQEADSTMVSIANSPKFKRQADYFDDDKEIYWSPNHRLLDTAYVLNDIEIAQDATTVPELEYVVRGKLVKCANYDYSYQHVPNGSYSSGSESHAHFSVGDSVTLYNTTGDGVLNADVFIIDKWAMIGPDGVEEYRFRFSDAPDLNYTDGIPAIKNFYMKNASNQTWHMNTADHVFDEGTISTCLKVTTTSVTTSSSAPPVYTIGGTVGTELWTTTGPQFFGLDDIMNMGYTDGQLENLDLSIYDQIPVKITQPNGTGNPILLTGETGTTSANVSTTQTVEVITRNQVKLPDTASSTNDVYNGLEIELTATDSGGEITRQVRMIEDYIGSTRVASITTPWDAGDAPAERSGVTYKYKIFSRPDLRVTINPTMQLMDYMTSKVYGKGLDANNDLSKSDWLHAARVCDSRGTQTLNIASASATAGDRYVLTSDGTTSGNILTMGRVRASTSSATEVVMEECFGSFTKEFMKNSHSYEAGDIIYTSKGYYRVTSAGAKSTKPTHTSGTTNGMAYLTSFPIYKISQSGSTNSKSTTISSTSLTVSLTNTAASNAVSYMNPVVFSLYDMSFVKYWRWLGWEKHHQRWVTRHQTCGTVDTSSSVLDTVSGFLQQMNAMLTFESGKYVINIATTTDTIASDIANSGDTGYTKGSELNVRYITESDIIGNISVKDAGVSKAYNTVNSQIEMPASQWKGKSVSFYDSNMLKADKMIVKQGSLSQPSVINYFNARINVENFLRKSRFGMSINFTMGPKGLLLKAGDTIKISHTKFGWSGKLFRIKNLNFQENCNVTVSADEYDDSFYTIQPPRLPSVLNDDFRAPIEAVPGTPSNLAASAGAVGSINLSWTNASGTKASSESEIWFNTSNSQYGNLLATVKGTATTFQHNVGLDGATRYYWIRHKKSIFRRGKQKVLYSAFHGSANATTVIPSSLFEVILQADSHNFKSDTDGNISSPNDITFTARRHNLSAAVVFTTSPSVTLTGSGDTRVLSKANMGSNTNVQITATVTSTTAERDSGANNTYTSSVTILRTDSGDDGSPGSPGSSGKARVNHFVYHQASAASQPNTPSATSYAFSNNSFNGLTSGWSLTPPTFAAGNANKYWYSYFTAVEDTAGGGSATSASSNLTFSASVQGIGFSGLVTFSSNNLTDGSATYNPATVVNAGTTTIDGGKITASSITASQIAANTVSTANLAANCITASQITGNSITANEINFTPVTSGNAAADVNAGSVSINANRISLTATDIGLGNVDNDSTSTIRSGTTASNVGLGNVSNYSPANQLINGWATTITAGALKLGNSSGARIELVATTSQPYILIADS